MKKMMQPLTS